MYSWSPVREDLRWWLGRHHMKFVLTGLQRISARLDNNALISRNHGYTLLVIGTLSRSKMRR